MNRTSSAFVLVALTAAVLLVALAFGAALTDIADHIRALPNGGA